MRDLRDVFEGLGDSRKRKSPIEKFTIGTVAVIAVLVIIVIFGWATSGGPYPWERPLQPVVQPVHAETKVAEAPPVSTPKLVSSPAPPPSVVKKKTVAAPKVPVVQKPSTPKPKVVAIKPPTEKKEGTWQYFGVDPYATSQEEAMRTRESAFRTLGLPEPVIALFLLATDTPGKKVRIVNGEKLSGMLSKGGVLHRNVLVDFVKPPVSGKMEYAAPAQMWQVTWHGELYTLLLPEVCNNWSYMVSTTVPLPLAPQPAPPPAPLVFKSIPGACPDVYTLKVNVWGPEAATLPGVGHSIDVEQRMAQEELEEKFTGTPHVSRMHGAQFRKAHASGDLKWAVDPYNFRVSLIMTPEAHGGSPEITKEKILGDFMVKGIYHELRFTKAQLEKWDAIRVVALDGGIMSPPRYHVTGYHEMRFFNHLPGTTLGEWDANSVPDCIMNEHWIVQ